MTEPAQKHILFLCTGNSCRSPMAEYLFRHRAGPASDWVAESAGLFAPQNRPATPEAIQVLAEGGVDLRPHRSKGLTPELADRADLIIVMTRGHLEDLRLKHPQAAQKARLMTAFGSREPTDILDPIGLPIFTYRRVRNEIDSALADLILHLRTLDTAPAKGPAMNIALAADHGGFDLKEVVKKLLTARGIAFEDLGAHDKTSVDYPDFAAAVARRVSDGTADQGIIVCTTGIGVTMAANRFPRVRAALCLNPLMAQRARQHNNANVLTMGGALVTPSETAAILDAWLGASFEGGRHARRVAKMEDFFRGTLDSTDPAIAEAIRAESRRQRENLELIASENYTSPAVCEAVGSILTNKYAEGYPAKRWYNGCEHVDEAERLAIARAKQLFGAEHANVQPHCGSAANMAVYFAMLNPGDTILAMSLADGGHLTHGHKLNFSGRFFNVVPYGVRRETEQLDYDGIAALAEQHKPRMIVAGASAYPRVFDFPRLRQIADRVGAWLMVDMAHIAGLVAAGAHPSPVPHADFVTSTTHKTLRGPRSGLILCRAAFAEAIDKQVFPGIQGGPLMHVIAGKAVCFQEALQPAFAEYQRQIVKNAAALAAALKADGFRLVSGGTDNHLMLVDVTSRGLTGKDAATALDRASITVNKNAIPFDTKSPFVTSGIRVGTPAVTTRGMKEPEMAIIAKLIGEALAHPQDAAHLEALRGQVHSLTAKFPVP